MEEVNLLDEVKNKGKVYNESSITTGAFLGGPIAAGYLLIENYKALGQTEKVNKAWTITILGAMALFFIIMLIPENIKIPNVVFSVICVVCTKQIFKIYQENDIEEHIREGGELHSMWRACGISLLVTLVTIGIYIGGFLLYEKDTAASVSIGPEPSSSSSIANIQSQSYGDLGHIIVYDESQISSVEIDGIAGQFEAFDFFDEENQKTVYLERDWKGDYVISLSAPGLDLEKEETQTKYKILRAQIDEFLKDGTVQILLLDESLEQELARFE